VLLLRFYILVCFKVRAWEALCQSSYMLWYMIHHS
jgi:hypothetical protein